MPRSAGPDKSWLSTDMPKDEVNEFRRIAAKNERRVTAELRIAVREHIKKQGAK